MAKASIVGPRVLLYDLETAFNIVAAFQLWDRGGNSIPHQNVISERYIICACWKWLGEDKIHSVAVTDDPKRYKKNPYDDYHVVRTIHEVLSEADVVIAHYGNGFDNKYVKTRALFHGLAPIPPFVSVDTQKIAKSQFLFNSNRLDYLGKFLGVGRKIETKLGLWMEVLRGSQKAIKEMVHYNKGDVSLLEKVFLKLRPFIPEHVNRELYGGGSHECPRCGSSHVQARGIHRAISRIYQRWNCQGCGGWYRTAKAEKGTVTLRNL
jgi:hypothetical protein